MQPKGRGGGGGGREEIKRLFLIAVSVLRRGGRSATLQRTVIVNHRQERSATDEYLMDNILEVTLFLQPLVSVLMNYSGECFKLNLQFRFISS